MSLGYLFSEMSLGQMKEQFDGAIDSLLWRALAARITDGDYGRVLQEGLEEG